MMLLAKCLMLTFLGLTTATLPLSDANAYVGKTFIYQLDQNDFKTGSIEVHEANSDHLPGWLHFDTKTFSLQGIPQATDTGAYVININNEMFAITVSISINNKVIQSQDSTEPQTECGRQDAVYSVFVTLVGDDNLGRMNGGDNIRLVRSAGSHLKLKSEDIRLVKRRPDLLSTEKELLVEEGNVERKADTEPMTLTWVVGCNSVQQHLIDKLEFLQSTAKNGEMAEVIGADISHWQVIQVRRKRDINKRQVTATPTPSTPTADTSSHVTSPTMSSVTPTATVSQTTTMTPLEVNADGLPDTLRIRRGEIFSLRLPEGLYNYPNREIEFRLGENPENWEIVYEAGNPNPTLIGLVFKDKRNVNLVLLADHSLAGSAMLSVPIKVRDPVTSLQRTYTVNLKRAQSLSALAIARTLAEQGSFDNIRLVAINSEPQSNSATVIFGEAMSTDSNCKERNQILLDNLQKLEGQEVDVTGSKYYERVTIEGVVRSMPYLPCVDSPPVLNNAVYGKYRRIEVVSGELLELVIDPKLFLDDEDGDLTNMEIFLIDDGIHTANGGSISLDSQTRRLQALTWNKLDTTTEQYVINALDSKGHMDEADIEVRIIPNRDVPETHRFSITLKESYTQFANNHQDQILVYKQLNSIFPNSTITIESVKSGSVVINFHIWNQKMLSSKTVCPKVSIEELTNKLFDSKQRITRSLIDALQDFGVTRLEFTPLGVCEFELRPLSDTHLVAKETSTDNNKNSIVIIAVVVSLVVVIIVVIVLAIVCIKRQRKQRQHDREANSTCIQARVPVVLPEEDKVDGTNIPLFEDHEMTTPTPLPPNYDSHDYPTPSPTCSERS